LLLAAEVAARMLGLHRPLLYEATAYGYRIRPSQELERFGNHISYNAYGMRSQEISPQPRAGTLRILCIGDSITNGGTLTDQSQTYPALLEGFLRDHRFTAEVLNASAGGWALGNEEGWLHQQGIFGSAFVVLEIGTLDLFQTTVSSSLVDHHPAFPSHPPTLGLEQALRRYLLPRIAPAWSASDPGTQVADRDVQFARRSIGRLLDMARFIRAGGATPIVVHVEQPQTLEADDAVTMAAKEELRGTLNVAEIPFVSAGPAMRDGNFFRDGLHPNAAGNRILAKLVAEQIMGRLALSRPTQAFRDAVRAGMQ
jgi:lysophospholipase L1-like esterase